MVLSLNSRVERYKREEEAPPARVCGVWGVGFRVQGLGCRVAGSTRNREATQRLGALSGRFHWILLVGWTNYWLHLLIGKLNSLTGLRRSFRKGPSQNPKAKLTESDEIDLL